MKSKHNIEMSAPIAFADYCKIKYISDGRSARVFAYSSLEGKWILVPVHKDELTVSAKINKYK